MLQKFLRARTHVPGSEEKIKTKKAIFPLDDVAAILARARSRTGTFAGPVYDPKSYQLADAQSHSAALSRSAHDREAMTDVRPKSRFRLALSQRPPW